jgi:hypothetical protein
MKIATCISGHTRNYKEVYPNFNFDTDVFVSSCIQSGLPPEQMQFLSYHYHGYVPTDNVEIEDVLNKYLPKVWEFVDDNFIPQELDKFKEFKTTLGYNLIHVGMMFHRIYQSNKLKKVWEYQNNFVYDFVIRTRFDIKIENIEFDKNKLYFFTKDNNFRDIFFYGSSYLIDRICNVYEWFTHQTPEFLSRFESAEFILKYYIDQLNIQEEISSNFDIAFLKDSPIETKYFNKGKMSIIYG